MKVLAITFAAGVCVGLCAEAAVSRPVIARQVEPLVSLADGVRLAGGFGVAGGDGASHGSRADAPGFILPQVAPPTMLPSTLLPSSAPPQGLAKPDPRPGTPVGHRFEPPRGRTCFSQAETRENIASHRLSEPISALRAGRSQGEALRARLCRWKPDEYVYEVSVLRRDGRVIHIYMNARSGQTVGALDGNERR